MAVVINSFLALYTYNKELLRIYKNFIILFSMFLIIYSVQCVFTCMKLLFFLE